jgi:hypothetical protein
MMQTNTSGTQGYFIIRKNQAPSPVKFSVLKADFDIHLTFEL